MRRLRGLDDPSAAAPFLPEFMADRSSRSRKRAGSAVSSPCSTRAISTCSRTPLPPAACAARWRSSAKPRTAPWRFAPTAACSQPACPEG